MREHEPASARRSGLQACLARRKVDARARHLLVEKGGFSDKDIEA
jgi:hypothetical protein